MSLLASSRISLQTALLLSAYAIQSVHVRTYIPYSMLSSHLLEIFKARYAYTLHSSDGIQCSEIDLYLDKSPYYNFNAATNPVVPDTSQVIANGPPYYLGHRDYFGTYDLTRWTIHLIVLFSWEVSSALPGGGRRHLAPSFRFISFFASNMAVLLVSSQSSLL